MADPLATALASAEVLDTDGRAHPLGDVFRDRPVALLFVRHFG